MAAFLDITSCSLVEVADVCEVFIASIIKATRPHYTA
jgi:hypothetical protein